MSFNGSGTFVLNIGGYPYVTGTVISSVNVNLLLQDIANGLSLTVTRDGQMTMTGPLHLGSNYIDGVTNLTVSGAITVGGSSVTTFPSGTRLSFQQSTAPTGWTQDTTTTGDALMRFTTSAVTSGGSQAFSSWNGLTVTGGHSLVVGELPSHTHTATSTDAGHGHPLVNGVLGQAGAASSIAVPGGATALYNPAATGTSYANVTTTIGNTGSDLVHTHPLSNSVRYLDFIIAVKN